MNTVEKFSYLACFSSEASSEMYAPCMLCPSDKKLYLSMDLTYL